MLIDSGASHNFISPTVVQSAQLETTKDDNLKLLVGTGITVNGLGVCKMVPLQIQSYLLVNDFVVLEPGSVDVILGVHWLRSLGRCEVEWELQVSSFVKGDTRITLQGDKKIQCGRRIFDELSTEKEV